ncbi:MAG: hypothetical protein QOE92_1780 [Chloroflexota bacterium]|nr:hypothetical protein [Chloroflexota bacterium]
MAATDQSGSRWSSADLKTALWARYPRRLTHLLVLLAAMIPVSVTMASAQQPQVSRQRIELVTPLAVDHPEAVAAIPADPPPPPPP